MVASSLANIWAVRSNPARELGGRFLREKKEEGRKK
jgi:hypothetical protein